MLKNQKQDANAGAPHNVQLVLNQAMTLHSQGQLLEALELYQHILSLQPRHFDALHLLGLLAANSQNFEGAAQFLHRALAVNPKSPEVHNNYANVLKSLNRQDEALQSYARAIALRPGYAEAWYNQGNAQQELQDYAAAEHSYLQAIALKPDYTDAYINCGNTRLSLKQYQAALSSYETAIALQPGYAPLYYNRGNALKYLKRLPAALESYQHAIRLNPDYPEAFLNAALTLNELHRFQAAQAICDHALSLNPDDASLHNQRGLALIGLKQYAVAQSSLLKAIELQPDFAEAYNNLGNLHTELKHYPTARASYEQALALKPDSVPSLYNLGHIFYEQKQYVAALGFYELALAIDADYDFLFGHFLHTRMQICDWRDLDANLAHLADKIKAGATVAAPFPVLTLLDDPALQKRAAEIWTQHKHPTNRQLPALSAYKDHDRIRIAYLSADFHDHATAQLMAGLFEAHDRQRFEVTAVSFGPDLADSMQQRLQQAFERFADVRSKTDLEVALLLREWQIDIAIDLKGHTQDSRPDIFALRAAPVQISYLGYPGTMGADYIDYILADKTVIPPDQQDWYTEKVIYLPDCYQINDDRRRIADTTPSRAEAGLPETALVFCCHNSNYKITPTVFAIWMRLLHEVEDSVLWLLESNTDAVENLRRSAEQHGIDAQRLIFAPRIRPEQHLARYRLADLFLDTPPCNAHTTASDALWAGLPVLTSQGNGFAARVAASLLQALGLPELVTASLADYEALALKLAREKPALEKIRTTLAANIHTSPLFDTERFGRELETVYERLWQVSK
jgi:predicted O-linked N-acetylglucosamine transferase (SPINDLY family)